MRAVRNSAGDVIINLNEGEAREIVEDGMFDDADTLAVTERLRDVIYDILKETDEDEEEEEEDDFEEEEEDDEPLLPPIPSEDKE